MDEVIYCRSYSNCDGRPVKIVDGQAQLSYSPRISVLLPLLFVLYTKDISAIIRRHGLWHHWYPDYTQVYFDCKPEEVNSLTLQFSACIDDLCGWMRSNRLKLNADKTEWVWVTTRQWQSIFAAPNLTVGGSIIVPTKGTHNLGVFFDSKIDLKSHISNICRTCYFQLRQLRTVRRSLQPEILKTLLHTFVSCRLDYCNSLIALWLQPRCCGTIFLLSYIVVHHWQFFAKDLRLIYLGQRITSSLRPLTDHDFIM